MIFSLSIAGKCRALAQVGVRATRCDRITLGPAYTTPEAAE